MLVCHKVTSRSQRNPGLPPASRGNFSKSHCLLAPVLPLSVEWGCAAALRPSPHSCWGRTGALGHGEWRGPAPPETAHLRRTGCQTLLHPQHQPPTPTALLWKTSLLRSPGHPGLSASSTQTGKQHTLAASLSLPEYLLCAAPNRKTGWQKSWE